MFVLHSTFLWLPMYFQLQPRAQETEIYLCIMSFLRGNHRMICREPMSSWEGENVLGGGRIWKRGSYCEARVAIHKCDWHGLKSETRVFKTAQFLRWIVSRVLPWEWWRGIDWMNQIWRKQFYRSFYSGLHYSNGWFWKWYEHGNFRDMWGSIEYSKGEKQSIGGN